MKKSEDIAAKLKMAALQINTEIGIEDGIVVRLSNGSLMMLGAEMYSAPNWVKMRLGSWRSEDGYKWWRHHTLRESSGNTNGTDPHAASWGPSLVLNPESNRWRLIYVGYRSGGRNISGWKTNFDGIIYSAVAESTGDEGLLSDFSDGSDWREHKCV